MPHKRGTKNPQESQFQKLIIDDNDDYFNDYDEL